MTTVKHYKADSNIFFALNDHHVSCAEKKIKYLVSCEYFTMVQ